MIARAIECNIFGVLDLMNNCLLMSNIYCDFVLLQRHKV